MVRVCVCVRVQRKRGWIDGVRALGKQVAVAKANEQLDGAWLGINLLQDFRLIFKKFAF